MKTAEDRVGKPIRDGHSMGSGRHPGQGCRHAGRFQKTESRKERSPQIQGAFLDRGERRLNHGGVPDAGRYPLDKLNYRRPTRQDRPGETITKHPREKGMGLLRRMQGVANLHVFNGQANEFLNVGFLGSE